MTPRGLIKATNYYNRCEAAKDWNRLAFQYPELAKKFMPPDTSGWRTFDKALKKLREAVEAEESEKDSHA